MSDLTGALEALLLMATDPLSAVELAGAANVPVLQVESALIELQAFYHETGRGFELRNVAGGWRYYTRAAYSDLLSAWVLEGQQSRLSQAALETLSVITYLQPISRGRVAAVRGVNVDGVMRTLASRDLIEEVSRDGDSGAMLFGTTPYFLERMGLGSLDELPPIAPYLPDATQLDDELSTLVGESSPQHGSADPQSSPRVTPATEQPVASAPQKKDTP